MPFSTSHVLILLVPWLIHPPPLPPLSITLTRGMGVEFRRAVDLSNDPRFLLGIVPAGNVITTAHELSRFYQLLLERARATSGVESAGLTQNPPLGLNAFDRIAELPDLPLAAGTEHYAKDDLEGELARPLEHDHAAPLARKFDGAGCPRRSAPHNNARQ